MRLVRRQFYAETVLGMEKNAKLSFYNEKSIVAT